MSFIRVSEQDESKTKVDLNTVHIVSFRPASDAGAVIDLTDGGTLYVNESPRQLRGFIKKAQGTLPVAAAVSDDPAVPAE